MLFKQTIAVNCENHVKYANIPCGQSAEFLYVKASGTYRNHTGR
jgi:hypothetical protein